MKLRDVFLYCLILLFIAGCGKKEKNVITIGAVLPLTGNSASYGKSAQKGIGLALANYQLLNSSDSLRIIYEDTQAQPTLGVNAVQKLITQDKVQIIIGAMASSVTLAIAPIAENNKVLLISPASSAPEITYAGDYIFRTAYSDVYEGRVLADYAYIEKKIKRFDILYINNAYGLGISNEFKKTIIGLGGDIVKELPFNQNQINFKVEASKIKSSNIGGLLIFGYKELGEILNQLAEQGVKCEIFSSVMFEDPYIIKVAGKNANGVIYTYPSFNLKSSNSVVKDFVSAFTNRYNEPPDIYAALAYDATNIILQGISKVGYSADKLKEYLYNLHGYEGVTGKTSFDKNGDVIKDLGLKIVKNERFEWLLNQYH